MSKAKVVAKVLGKGAGKSSASKAAKRKRPSKATQKGVKFKKNYSVQEGAGLDPETGGSVRAAREVDAGKAGKVTRGKLSSTTAFRAQEYLSKSQKKRISKYVELERKKRTGKLTAEERKFMRTVEEQDKAALRSRNVKIGQGVSAANRKKAKEVDHYGEAIKEANKYGIYESEHTEKLTPPQKAQVLKAARASGKTPSTRKGEAIAEEMRLQSGRTKPGESAVRTRKGTRGMRTRGEETQLKEMLTGTRRESVTGKLKPETEEALLRRMRKNMSKGGKVTKRATGAHDYRMNKGGLLLSSVDNRKKK